MSLGIILAYLLLLIFLGVFASRLLRMTGSDYFLASRGIGPFMLLMSVFGTTMTAFALVGSTGKTFEKGIGVYGLMASWSGIIHSAVFFLIGARVWALGKKHGYVTQLSFFRDRYQSDALSLMLFPVVVCFVLIYVLMGVIGAGRTLEALTPETWSMRHVKTEVTLNPAPASLNIPATWQDRLQYDAAAGKLVLTGSLAPKNRPVLIKMNPASAEWKAAVAKLFAPGGAPNGAFPYWAGMGLVCLVVLFYVFFGGMRATAWANTMQTLVFMVMGLVAFVVITRAMGGPAAASQTALNHAEGSTRLAREGLLGKFQFLTYCFIPLSVGMFPHLFQHWLTARRASNFKLTVVAHPICILITWIPCVLVGMWAAGVLPHTTRPNAVLGIMVSRFSTDVLSGLIGAGILAAIMSSMDSQFLCLGSLFTNDIAARYFGHRQVTERQRVLLGRIFVVAIVVISYLIGLFNPQSVFDLGVWCFTGFASLFPLVFAALYWKRSNKYGAIACVITVGVLWLVFLPKLLTEGEFLILGLMPVTFILAASTTAMVVVTLLTAAPDRALVEKFFPSPSPTPVPEPAATPEAVTP